jgi:Undecaprenyl-phosphate galactose phosphotransferase WbaP
VRTSAPSHPTSYPKGSGFWTTVFALVGVDLIGLGVVAGCLGMLAIGAGQAPQWIAFEQWIAFGFGLVAACFLPMAYAAAGLYQVVDRHPAEELRRLATITLLTGASATIVAAAWVPAYAVTMAFATGLAAVIVPAARVLGRILLARTDWWGVPVVVLGDGAHSETVIATLQRWPELGLRPVAPCEEPYPLQGPDDVAPVADLSSSADGLTSRDVFSSLGVLHPIEPEQAPLLARRYHIPYAVLAMPTLSEHERARLITHIGKFFRRLYVVSNGLNPAALWTARSASQGIMGISVKHVQLSTGARAIKRVFDVAASLLGLIAAIPLIATIAALIKLDSKGPVFFRQERMGINGRCFTVLKFRTMHVDAEAKLQSLLDDDPERRVQYEQYHKLDDDPRVTRMGKWLRRFSLDELPQLWNVLRGDMSLVGPRAYMPGELPKMNGLSRSVLQCPPGLTGLWQVSGRNNLDFSTRVDLDVHYMQNWTVWLDLYILLRTIPVVLTGEGAK